MSVILYWDQGHGLWEILCAGMNDRPLAKIRKKTNSVIVREWEGEIYLPIVYSMPMKKYDEAKAAMEKYVQDFFDYACTDRPAIDKPDEDHSFAATND